MPGKHTVPRRPAVEKTCPQCGTIFKTWPSVDGKFCSRPCMYAAHTLRKTHLCETCGAPFRPRSVGTVQQQAGIRHLFCSRECYAEIRSGEAYAEKRFSAKVAKTGGCWLWTANTRRGYGEFWNQNIRMPAHHFAWESVGGLIPAGMFVLHDCPDGDNPLCVRNDGLRRIHVVNGIARPQFGHLWIGTQADNMADMQMKGRSPLAKLTPDEAREIKAHLAAGVGPTALSRLYGVTRSCIKAIQRGDTWRYV